MSGETPITELDFSGLKDHDEYAAIETAAIANGDFLPKASSSYKNCFHIHHHFNYIIKKE